MAGIHCVCSVRCIYSHCSFTHRFKCNAMMMVLVTSIPCAIKLQWCSHNIVNRSTVAARQHIICTTTRDGGGRSMIRRRESLVTEWCRYLRCCDCSTRALRFEFNLSFDLSKMDVFCLLQHVSIRWRWIVTHQFVADAEYLILPRWWRHRRRCDNVWVDMNDMMFLHNREWSKLFNKVKEHTKSTKGNEIPNPLTDQLFCFVWTKPVDWRQIQNVKSEDHVTGTRLWAVALRLTVSNLFQNSLFFKPLATIIAC